MCGPTIDQHRDVRNTLLRGGAPQGLKPQAQPTMLGSTERTL